MGIDASTRLFHAADGTVSESQPEVPTTETEPASNDVENGTSTFG